MTWAQVDEEQDDYFSCSDMSTSSMSDDEGNEAKEAEQLNQDEDSDLDDDIGRAHGPTTSLEKRRAQNQIMKAFAANLGATLTQKECEEAAAKTSNEEQLSIKDILAKQETTVRIINPRDYQTELFQRATTENVIAVLDTGSGKTHIATLLLRHVLDQELEERAKGGIHKIAFFLVRLPITRPTAY
jgi:endoribonuclease Dicer